MKALFNDRLATWGIVIGLLALIAPFAIGSPYAFHIGVLLCVFGGLATAWNIVGGFAGQISLGHSVFYGVGSYSAVILLTRYDINPWFGMLAGMAISAVLSVLISWPTFRLKGPFFTLVTIAILEVVRLLAIHDDGLTGGSSGLTVPINIGLKFMVFREKHEAYLLALVFFAITVGVAWRIRNSRLGFYLFAVREREDAAKAIGVDTVRVRIVAMIVSAVLTSMLGTFYAMYLTFIDPDSTFSLAMSIQVAMFALIGGLGTVAGPLVGTIVVLPIAEGIRGALSEYGPGLHGAIYGLVLIVAALKFPQGIVGAIRARFQRSAATVIEAAEVVAMPTPATVRAASNAPVLEARGLVKRFGGLTATNNVTLTLHQGEILGVIGPNGAGKTTLFNLLSGFMAPNAGEVKLRMADGGQVAIRTADQAAHLGIGRTFQIAQPFSGLTVLENIMLGVFMHTRDRAEARRGALQMAQFTGLAAHVDKMASELTVGGLKRLEMARALATKPRVLLLDEVMAGLSPTDIDTTVALIRRIRDEGVSVLMIEHQMRATMALSDRIVVIDAGAELVSGAPDAVVNDRRVIEAYLGTGYQHA